ncbi:Ger(x)C family spore germination protein [Paenibacillus sp. CGMCC 1.16610]|uniref:Ger(X)C family spore germination protein n=1 Tax=Paenibacillus anseongense TaxID=2682845 RepID=A0ABW9ULW7_9BACL|nr:MULTISPECIES: Ger(x)C family spore germination protein [Paenibacillus]MBA2941456.1 Ger(x)C family spore germination protein [Paenibacillus sp. CGMCC 1.16610]MVQ40274.1 Ger(x)C family spore germination protein [Paenibacillus anseongense]
MWQNLIKQILVVVLMTPLLTGCWDRLEIEDRAVVLAIGIDEAKPGDEKETSNATHLLSQESSNKGLIRVTVQIAVPGRIPLGTGGDTGGPADQKPVWVLTSVGNTIEDGLMNLQQQLADRLFYGHLRVIVLSETVAKKGIQNENDFFRRQPQVRRTVWMVVSKGAAADIMNATPQLERVPSLYLLATLEHAREMGKLPNIFLGVFFSASSAKGQEGTVPYLELKKESNIELAGMAYFKNDKMVGTSTALQIGHYMAIKQLNPGGYSILQEMPNSHTNVIFKTTHRKSKITTTIKNGKVFATIRCQVEGDLTEKSDEKVLVTKNNLLQLEEKIKKDAEKGFETFIQQTQEDGSDIFGFGEFVRATQPSYWNKEIKTKEKWESKYREMNVDVSMHVKIRRIGTKTK